MNTQRIGTLLVMTALVLFPRPVAASTDLVAYSLKEAERRLKRHEVSPSVENLGGITRVLGVVIDSRREDAVIVGQVVPGERPARLDDLAVALRSLLVHKQWPLVSIDRTPDTAVTRRQAVRFEGGIADTQFGKDLLDADIALKRLSLGLLGHGPVQAMEPLAAGRNRADVARWRVDTREAASRPDPSTMPAGVDDFWQQHDGTMAKWGFPSYFVLAMQQAQRCQTPQDLNTRFWFHPEGTRVTVRPGIAVIHDLGIAVQAEITAARISGTSTTLGNEAASEFAAAVTKHYEQLAAGYPAVGRIRPLLELVAVAHALESLTPGSTLKYWLTKYPVAEVRTPRVYELLTTCRGTSVRNGRGFGLELSGGIRLQALLQRLDEEGDVTAIRDLVVMSRPHDGALVWRIPLASWRIRGRHHSTAPAGPGDCLPPVADGAPIGCAVHERWYESPQP